MFVLGLVVGGIGGGDFIEFGEIDETDKVSTFCGDALEIEVVE